LVLAAPQFFTALANGVLELALHHDELAAWIVSFAQPVGVNQARRVVVGLGANTLEQRRLVRAEHLTDTLRASGSSRRSGPRPFCRRRVKRSAASDSCRDDASVKTE